MQQQTKRETLELIVRQLQQYDLNGLAASVAEACDLPQEHRPSNQLADLVQAVHHLDVQADTKSLLSGTAGGNASESQIIVDTGLEELTEDQQVQKFGVCLLDISVGKQSSSKAPQWSQLYSALHKGVIDAVAISGSGQYLATGSRDTSIKVLDVGRIKLRATDSTIEDTKPTIRTFYEHTETVNDLQFHPNQRILASCSDDKTIKLYDLQRSINKRSIKQFTDSHAVKTLCLHPTGEFMLTGVQGDGALRLYDILQGQCYSASTVAQDDHSQGINMVRYCSDGRMYCSAGVDGHLKIWDGVSGRCVRTIQSAHAVHPVASVQFSKSGRYVLSSGQDSVPKLWDVASGKPVMAYIGALQKSQPMAATLHNLAEDYVLSGCERTGSMVAWCARTGQLLDRYSQQQASPTRIVASLVDPGVFLCGTDLKARYWASSSD